MRKIVLKLAMCFSLSTLKLMAVPVVPGVSGSLDYGPGYRIDELNFSIQGPFGSPDVLSELKWEDLQIFYVGARGYITAWDHVYLRGSAGWGWILRGENEAHNFASDGRTDEFAAFNSTANDGDVADLSMGIGVNLVCWNKGLEIAPLVGYSFDQQNLTVKKHTVQTVALDPTTLGPVNGVKACYNSKWDGPWLGGDINYYPTCNLKISASAEYHWFRFRGRGFWKRFDCLTGDLFENPFCQNAHGTGSFFTLETSYLLSENWGFGILASFQRFKTKEGRHKSNICESINTFPANEQYVGMFPIVEETVLNPVIWNSFSISFEFHADY